MLKRFLLAGPIEIPDDRFFVTIPEGLTLVEMQETLLSQLPDFNPDELKQAIEKNSETPSSLGLTLSFIKKASFSQIPTMLMKHQLQMKRAFFRE